jgi:hypothetical protein
LHAFDRSQELVDSVDNNDMGMDIEMRDDVSFESERDEMEFMEFAEDEGDQLLYSVFTSL